WRQPIPVPNSLRRLLLVGDKKPSVADPSFPPEATQRLRPPSPRMFHVEHSKRGKRIRHRKGGACSAPLLPTHFVATRRSLKLPIDGNVPRGTFGAALKVPTFPGRSLSSRFSHPLRFASKGPSSIRTLAGSGWTDGVPRGTIQGSQGALRLNQFLSSEFRVSPNVPRETSCNQSHPLLDFRLAGVPWRESSRLPIKRVE